jgi:DNA-binding NtrC family response regulator
MPSIGLAPRILVADDDCAIRNSLSQILKLSGYEVEAVESGENAIEADLRLTPDVLISDVVMGGINGIEAANRILELAPHCQVILFSGQASTIDLLDSACDRGHHFEILSKPVPPQMLLDRLSRFTSKDMSGIESFSEVKSLPKEASPE